MIWPLEIVDSMIRYNSPLWGHIHEISVQNDRLRAAFAEKLAVAAKSFLGNKM